MDVRLNIGCGPVQPKNWINIDNSNRAKLASRLPWVDNLLILLGLLPATEFTHETRTVDVRKKLPFKDNSVTAVYTGELLEHLTQAEGKFFLRECFRVLKLGGTLRIRVPDNYRFWKNYTQDFERNYNRPREVWSDEHARWVRMFFDDICVKKSWLTSMGHYHKWMYDEITLIHEFEHAGFTHVERRALHDSRIPDVALVETREDLIIEGVKLV